MNVPQDRQAFQKQVLPNGITLYTYEFPFPVCHLEVILPVGAGHAHTKNGILPGAPHFLEHAQLIRSQRYSKPYELDRLIGLHGGHSNGTTYPKTTHYELDMPANQLDFAIDALFERTYTPLFIEDDLRPERGVVMNERNSRKFYPGRSFVSKFYHTEFLNDAEYPLEQLFGSDDDLNQMTPDVLEAMQREISLNIGVTFVAVGPSSFQKLADRVSTITTSSQEFETKIKPIEWADSRFRFCYFDTISQPTLEVAWVYPRTTYEEFRAISFIISLLINPTHGALHREFREEKGWTYGLDGNCQQRSANTTFGLSFPVNTKEQIEFIHKCLLERIRVAVNDQELVDAEINRYISSQVYNFQTAADIMSGAVYDLDMYGLIHTEAEWQKAVRHLADPTWRQEIVNRFFQAKTMGSLGLMPERRQKILARRLQS